MVLALVLWGCSFSTVDPAVCTANAECRDAFGLGYVCGAEGLCDLAAAEPRCKTFPPDLLDSPDADAIVIGALWDLSEDKVEAQTARLAVKQANTSGGLAGRDFAVVECDYQEGLDARGYDEAARALALYLADVIGAPAVVGPATSSTSTLVYPDIAGNGAMFISPSATSPALRALDPLEVSDQQPGLFWRTAPPDDLQGRAISDDLVARDVKTVAVIFQTGAYGDGLSAVFQEEFAGGGRVVKAFPFEDDNQLTDAVVDVGADAAVEEVLFISSLLEDAIRFLNAAGSLSGFADKGIFFPDGAADAALLPATSAASALWPNVRGTRPAPPYDRVAYQAFEAAYAAEYNGESASDSAWSSFAYDAAWLALYGSAWSHHREGGVQGTGIARGLRRVTGGSETYEIRPGSWLEVVGEFQAGRRIDVSGASGELDYDPTTEETEAPVEIWIISGGEMVAE